jgi:hypothetical protein
MALLTLNQPKNRAFGLNVLSNAQHRYRQQYAQANQGKRTKGPP